MRCSISSLSSPPVPRRPAPGPSPAAPRRRRRPAPSIRISSAASSAWRPSPTTIMCGCAARPTRVTPASFGSRARITWSPMATCCTSVSRLNREQQSDVSSRIPTGLLITDHWHLHLPAVADRAEVLVDAECDQHELRDDAHEDHGEQRAKDARDYQEQAGQRRLNQERQPGENSRQAENHRDDDGQPIEYLDDRRRDEAFPLKEIAQIEHCALLAAAPGILLAPGSRQAGGENGRGILLSRNAPAA